jgi:ferrous-iron efflux pump FieF
VALLTSAADALVDGMTALATFVGIRYAELPADLEHRFGHGKGEALAAFTQGVLLGATALVLGLESLGRLIDPTPLRAVDTGIWIAIGSLGVAGALAIMQTLVARRTGSTAIAADQVHYVSDVAMNLAVLAALAVTKLTGWDRADPAFAVVIAGYMVWNAWHIVETSSRELLDRELPQSQRDRIEKAVLGCRGARDLHDLRTRDAGDRVFVEFHIEVDGDIAVRDGHAIVDAAENAVAALFPRGSEVIGHLEPAGILDRRLDDRVHRRT